MSSIKIEVKGVDKAIKRLEFLKKAMDKATKKIEKEMIKCFNKMGDDIEIEAK